jgi:hypothetical protein
MKVDLKLVDVFIDDVVQTESDFIDAADNGGVGHGGQLLAEAIFDVISCANAEEEYFGAALKTVIPNLESLIDIAAGEAIRDIAVRATILKKQLKTSDRYNKIMSLLEGAKDQKRVHIPDDPCANLLIAFKKLDFYEEDVSELATLLQEWIEEDKIFGKFSEDFVFHKLSDS